MNLSNKTAIALLFITYFLIVTLPLFSQSSENGKSPNYTNPPNNYEYTGTNDLARGFNGINLGADIEKVKELLQNDSLFYYKTQDFKTLSDGTDRNLTVRGSSFIDNAYFVFSKDDILISISLFLDTTHLDYSTLYQTLTKKYGRPQLKLNTAVWTQGDSTLILEKPLHIKYISNKALIDQSAIDKNTTLPEARQKFIELF